MNDRLAEEIAEALADDTIPYPMADWLAALLAERHRLVPLADAAIRARRYADGLHFAGRLKDERLVRVALGDREA